MPVIDEIVQLQARHGISTEISTSVDRRKLIYLFTCISRINNHTRYQLVTAKFDQPDIINYVHNQLAPMNHELKAETSLDMLTPLALEVFEGLLWRSPWINVEAGHDIMAVTVLTELLLAGILREERGGCLLKKSWLYNDCQRVFYNHRARPARTPEGQRVTRYIITYMF